MTRYPQVSPDEIDTALGILDDMTDHYERNDDPADWPAWVRNAYDLLRRIGKRANDGP